MMQKHLNGKVAGGGGRFLAEKLPDCFVFKLQEGLAYMLSGALEVHRLAVQDKLKGREEELTEEIINATCTVGGWECYKEVTLTSVGQISTSSLTEPGCLYLNDHRKKMRTLSTLAVSH